MSESPLIFLDGSRGEGGGSILRVSAGLACLLHRPLRIINIRKNRKQPGLRLQHLIGLETLASLTGGSTDPLHVGLTKVDFFPGTEWKSDHTVSIRTAGNIGMLSQTLHNALSQAPHTPSGYHIHVNGGGTYGKYAPGTAYLNHVTFAIFRRLGYHVSIEVLQHGYYPKGGAQAIIHLQPASNPNQYHGLHLLERGELESIEVAIHAEDRLKKPEVAERIMRTILSILISNNFASDLIKVTTSYHPSRSVGVGVDGWLTYSNGVVLGMGTVLGERGVSSEIIGKKVAQQLLALVDSTETVDEHAADQILPFLWGIPKPSQFILPRITSHFQTNLNILNEILPRKWDLQKIANSKKKDKSTTFLFKLS